MKPYDYHVFVCTCPTCSKKNAENVLLAFRHKVEKQALLNKVKVTRTGCLSQGECKNGPLVVIYPQGVWYRFVTVNDVDTIIEKHLVNGQLVSKLLHFKLS